ncbi:hypothetical protein [Arthrobacter sp. H5]|uniref:hypothetical protein n=1 Tax=Arthrobacter sp. H5 TaxID=1267973 RepID=UPI000481FA2E|nr:hypothetical protein [Arthrobacter sp. H5]
MELSDVKWNEEARGKILADADHALQEAVREAASSHSDSNRDAVYKFLFEKLQPQFVDFKPGPDLSKYADAVVNGEIGSGSEK